MGYRELWMGFWMALDGRSETMVQSRVLPSSWSMSAARPRDGVMHGRRGRFRYGTARFVKKLVSHWTHRCSDSANAVRAVETRADGQLEKKHETKNSYILCVVVHGRSRCIGTTRHAL